MYKLLELSAQFPVISSKMSGGSHEVQTDCDADVSLQVLHCTAQGRQKLLEI